MLENVEEFKTWGPLNRRHHPIKSKQGDTFRRFVHQLEDLGYKVEYRELVAADYGAPTMRKRFFLIARCDGKPIIWPEPTHAPKDSPEVAAGLKEPYVGAYTQIDFSLPCPSIFDSKQEIWEKYGIRAQRPLAEKTMQRIARGLRKFVLQNPDPFLIEINHGGGDARRLKTLEEPLPTITGKHGFGIVTPYIMCNNENNAGASVEDGLPTITTGNRNYLMAPTLIQYHSETAAGEVRGQKLEEPVMTVDGSNRYGLVSAFLHKYFDGGYKGNGDTLERPLPTVTAVDHNSICAVNLIQMNNHCDGRDITSPIPTITAGDGHFGEVRAFLAKYYGQGTGQDVKEPLDTITANDRFGLVTIESQDYVIVDIGLRMLEPKELYGCQGFPEDYIIDRDDEGNPYPRAEQVKRCGNAVCPPIPAALVRANLPELCKAVRLPICRPDRMRQEENGQLRFA